MAAADEKTGLCLTSVTTVSNPRQSTTSAADTLAVSSSGSIAGLNQPSAVSTPATAHNDLNPFDTDLEAMVSSRTLTGGDDACGMKSVSHSNLKGCPEGQVWPGQAHWKKKAKAAKMNRHSCQCLARLSKRNRVLVKVLIGLLVIALGVGVGLGISRKLGASIWKPSTN